MNSKRRLAEDTTFEPVLKKQTTAAADFTTPQPAELAPRTLEEGRKLDGKRPAPPGLKTSLFGIETDAYPIRSGAAAQLSALCKPAPLELSSAIKPTKPLIAAVAPADITIVNAQALAHAAFGLHACEAETFVDEKTVGRHRIFSQVDILWADLENDENPEDVLLGSFAGFATTPFEYGSPPGALPAASSSLRLTAAIAIAPQSDLSHLTCPMPGCNSACFDCEDESVFNVLEIGELGMAAWGLWPDGRLSRHSFGSCGACTAGTFLAVGETVILLRPLSL